MIRAKVIKTFTDKYTKVEYKKGIVICVTPERFDEIMSVAKFLYKIDEVEDNAAAENTDLGDGFDIMSVKGLKEYADAVHKMSFKTGAKKAEIIKILRDAENENA